MRNYFIIVWMISLGHLLSASSFIYNQMYFGAVNLMTEICHNGIDDDLDGRTDLDDPDCTCANLIPNGNFEMQEDTSGSSIDLLTLGGNLTFGLTSWHGVIGNPQWSDRRYCPFFYCSSVISGERNIALWNSGLNHPELLGTCLNEPLLPGETYEIEFTFLTSCDQTSRALDLRQCESRQNSWLYFYGKSQCASIQSVTSTCDFSTRYGLIVLDSVSLPDPDYQMTPDNYGTIKQVIKIPAKGPFEMFWLGFPCHVNVLNHIVFIDQLKLIKTSQHELIEAYKNVCSGETHLTLPLFEALPSPPADIQWLLNGVPLPTETLPTLIIKPNTPSGIYEVAWKNGPSCGRSNQYTFSAPTYMHEVMSSSSLLCHGDSLLISAKPGLNVSYNWSTGQTTPDLFVTNPGHYQLSVTWEVNNIRCMDTFSITIGTIPSIDYSVQITPVNSTSQGQIDISPVVDIDSIVWSHGPRNLFLDNLAPGRYCFQLYKSGFCAVDTCLILPSVKPPLKVSWDITKPLCRYNADGKLNLTVQDGCPPYSLEAFDTLMAINNSFSITHLLPDKYHFRVIDAEGHLWTDSITLVAENNIFWTIVGTPSTCNNLANGNIRLQLQDTFPDYTLNWSNGSTFPDQPNLVGGYNYSFQIQQGQCLYQDTVFLPVQELASFSIVDTGHQGCEPEGTYVLFDTLTNGSAFESWGLVGLNSVSSVMISNLHPEKNYHLWFRTAQGCLDTFSFRTPSWIPFNIRLEALDSSQSTLIYQVTSSESISSYQWIVSQHDPVICSECAEFSVERSQEPQTLTVIAQNQEGCRDTMQVTIAPQPVQLPYLPDIFSPNGDLINDVWHTPSILPYTFSVQIFDRWGNRLYQQQGNHLDELRWDGSVDGKILPTGVYTYTLELNPGQITRQFLFGAITLIQ